MTTQNQFPGGFQPTNGAAPQGFGVPAAAPSPQGAPQGPTDFVLAIPPDPSWEPFETTDTLEKDGCYAGVIKSERVRNDKTKSPGVFLTIELLDEDARGRTLSKFLTDPRSAKKDVFFVWRGLMRSITGSTEGGKGGLNYTPGVFTNQTVYFKTESYIDDGNRRTSVGAFMTKAEYDDAVAKNLHRWAPKVTGGGATGVGGMPTGAPGGFGLSLPPGNMGGQAAPGGGFPQAPVQTQAQVAPPPPAAAPMAPAPQQNGQNAVLPFGAAPPPAPTAAPQGGFGGWGVPPQQPQPPQQQQNQQPQQGSVPSVMQGFPGQTPQQ